ncbi:hypothetical protein Lser_V15G11445 [Lactuca serriola]
MRQMGFGDIWIQWIKGCLSSSRASVITNESVTKEFPIMRGVRQGDPLSPFLFIIDMEGLNISIKFSSFGLKVNFDKSKVYGIGVSNNDVASCAWMLVCDTASLPFNYLGMPFEANMSLKRNWRPIIERVQSKLSVCKEKTLSLGGRLSLVKSVLGSLPLFHFSLFKVPKYVVDYLEKLQRNFWWGGGDDKKKNVGWSGMLFLGRRREEASGWGHCCPLLRLLSSNGCGISKWIQICCGKGSYVGCITVIGNRFSLG